MTGARELPVRESVLEVAIAARRWSVVVFVLGLVAGVGWVALVEPDGDEAAQAELDADERDTTPREPTRELADDERDRLDAVAEEVGRDLAAPTVVPEDFELVQSVREEHYGVERVFISWAAQRDDVVLTLSLFEVAAAEEDDEVPDAAEEEAPGADVARGTETLSFGDVEVIEVRHDRGSSLTFHWVEDDHRVFATLSQQATEPDAQVGEPDRRVLVDFVESRA